MFYAMLFFSQKSVSYTHLDVYKRQVKYIFALYLAGNGASRIARLLNEENISSPTRYKREHGINYKQSVRDVYKRQIMASYDGGVPPVSHPRIAFSEK